MDTVPKDLDLGAVTEAVSGLPGVLNVHHAHAWALTTRKNIVSMHALVSDLEGAESLQRRIHALLSDRFGVYSSTVQVETECLETEESAAIDYSLTEQAEADRGSRNR